MGKWQEVCRRCSFGKEIYLWGWRWVVFMIWVLPIGSASLYDLLQGQGYVSGSWLKLSEIIATWVYWLWLGLGILAFIVITFEGAYRISRKGVQKNNKTILWRQNMHTPPYVFYLNRQDLRNEKRNLMDELEGMQKIWAVWHTGGNILEQGELSDPSIRPKEFKLILTDPEDEDMMERIQPGGRGNIQYWKTQIQRTAVQSRRLGSVYFYRGSIGDSLLIADPKKIKGDKFSDDAWARVDTTIPSHANFMRSSYRIVKGDAKGQFNALVQHYKNLLGSDRIREYKGEHGGL